MTSDGAVLLSIASDNSHPRELGTSPPRETFPSLLAGIALTRLLSEWNRGDMMIRPVFDDSKVQGRRSLSKTAATHAKHSKVMICDKGGLRQWAIWGSNGRPSAVDSGSMVIKVLGGAFFYKLP